MKLIAFIAFGGAIGAVGRYLISGAVTHVFGHGFPWGTLTVNVLGSFLMGVLIEGLALKWTLSPELRALFVTGILGAFTTFSAFSLDVSVLYKQGELLSAFFYIAGSVVFAVGALFLGLYFTRMILT